MAARLALRASVVGALLLVGCNRAPNSPVVGKSEALRSTTLASNTARFPALTGRVVDNADLLSAEEETQLASRLAALEERTTDQLVVVTVPSLGGRSVEEYSDALGNHWGIGQADKDNGVIVLVAPNERRTRIGLGFGLERIVSNERASQIIDRDMLPAFREQRWNDGISSAVDSIIAILVENEQVPRRRAR